MLDFKRLTNRPIGWIGVKWELWDRRQEALLFWCRCTSLINVLIGLDTTIRSRTKAEVLFFNTGAKGGSNPKAQPQSKLTHKLNNKLFLFWLKRYSRSACSLVFPTPSMISAPKQRRGSGNLVGRDEAHHICFLKRTTIGIQPKNLFCKHGVLRCDAAYQLFCAQTSIGMVIGTARRESIMNKHMEDIGRHLNTYWEKDDYEISYYFPPHVVESKNSTGAGKSC